MQESRKFVEAELRDIISENPSMTQFPFCVSLLPVFTCRHKATPSCARPALSRAPDTLVLSLFSATLQPRAVTESDISGTVDYAQRGRRSRELQASANSFKAQKC